MTAIATTYFRHLNAKNFIESLANSPSDSLYLFIAKTDPWNDDLTATTDNSPTTPVNGTYELRNAYDNMMGMKKVISTNAVKVIPRHDWVTNTAYDAWDDNDSAIFTKAFYVLTSELKVYKCLRAGASVSTVMPTHTGTTPTDGGDGYLWHYMFSVPLAYIETFLNTSFIPVETATSGTAKTYQDNCASNIPGRIYRAVITDAGSGYTSATATITGDGAGATASVTCAGGVVTAITITNPGTSAYTTAEITINSGSGTGATARLVLSPSIAHGYDPEIELGGYLVEVAIDLEYEDGGGDILINNDYRQLGLIKNPFNYGTTVVATGTTLNCLRTMTVTSIAGGSFQPDDVIVDLTTGAKAYIDAITDSSPYVIKYHQNYKTKYTAFGTSNTIQNGNGSGPVTATVSSLGNPEFEPGSGQILILENTTPTLRSDSTIEEIRIVVQF